MAGERVAGEKNHMQTQKSKQIIELSSMSEHSEEEITTKDFNQTELQLQQILDAEPMAMQNLTEEDLAETEASNWVNSHILELSNTYGVAFEGFEKETLALLMRINGRKTELDNKKQGKAITTPKSRGIGKNELKKLQRSLNKEVEGARNRGRETKVNKGIAYQLWSCRWVKLGFIEADGSKGELLLMWDSRVWTGTKVEEGTYSITYKFESTHNYFPWYFTGVYAPHRRNEKLECWEEMAAMKELCGRPWVTGGDFNTVRHMVERRGYNRVTTS
ncbi:hypothetical protein KY290_010453 [Solanum tuberosum]|uniref:Endonuclease/exonuclease/phosphatase n=1 Tax=Solanum tuberosum TaxID=4113 RepID=A0ABQ7VXT2_SOLTU|nr:hypothetical protein KY289_012383 [Solanum tuberosum]KAH0773316.1 hypothetical protein KY290_010453 [Solanum tuberosum]